jgi:hypothetical protein
MTRYQKMQRLFDLILRLKELEDIAHVRKAAKMGCACRRCKAARSLRG